MSQPIPWLILFLPLLSAALITLFLQRNPRISAAVSVGAVLVSFILSIGVFAQFHSGAPLDIHAQWLRVGRLNIEFGMHFDALCVLMLLVVTGVGSLIHIYSISYMKGDPAYSRFFACLSLFMFSMLGIVVSNNFFQMFIFWELVGVSSYLLVGFWYKKPKAADAAKKAFLTNRIGDFGFLTGIILVWSTVGTIAFVGIKEQLIKNPDAFDTVGTAIGLLIFCGAVGKSAQFPLHVWLPDAMEGPTPVSALIHAATMVAAGVYMLCRVFFIFNPMSLHVISWIGAITALLAALIAIQQDDIKRILAYSTLSQLGYMVMAVGIGEPPAAMYHLTTHAFFKALLFLGAGSVIHGMHDEQNIWKMGRLREKMPATFWTFLIGTLALAGLWPLSGFFSKDAILGAAYHNHRLTLFAIGIFVAFLTSFYMFRLVFVVFFGKAKSDAVHHAHESSVVMTGPLFILAIASAAGGFFGLEKYLQPQFSLQEAPGLEMTAVALGLGAFAIGLAVAALLYRNAETDPLPVKMVWFCKVARRLFYFDRFYEEVIALTQDALAQFAEGVDFMLKLFVRFLHGTTEFTGRALRLAQTGSLQTYTFFFAAGIAVVLYFMLLR
ncbi:MAG TPA: NADH-quinone oxidoreductase subunit L [Verrucomicrobiae bacterium]|jgi:NADH-quinone oxidoreductase subunit L